AAIGRRRPCAGRSRSNISWSKLHLHNGAESRLADDDFFKGLRGQTFAREIRDSPLPPSGYVANRGMRRSAFSLATFWKSASEKPSWARPCAVSLMDTSGKSLPNMICDVGTRLVSADRAGLLAALAIS